ncbi:bactericidal permeability-increasing protein isoform X1 [Entelurus aequoreus]|uniref:bactericidal permeability-increasing protein isoform X1 n=1 Tax=Entelurus aequoreus TaxID=161455 RepID=UPI002B1D5DC9|nr:bactericidal permeability-increasing protein isoform X1 [Entelurus aequoreus]
MKTSCCAVVAKMFVTAALSAIFFFCTRAQEVPAVQVVFTDKGLQYAKNVFTNWIQDTLELITLPDVKGQIPLGFLGQMDYTLSGVNISKCDFPDPSVQFSQEVSGLKTTMAGLNVALTGDWRVHWGILNAGGSFDVGVFQVGVASEQHLGRDSGGRLCVSQVICEATTGQVDLRLHGGSSWILQPFGSHLEAFIRRQIQARLCPTMEDLVENLEQHLQAMKVRLQVNQDLIVDLPLTSRPVVQAASLRFGLKGEVSSVKEPKEPPFDPQPFVLPEHAQFMLTAALSDFTLNSASFSCWAAGLLHTFIDDSMVPASSPVHLNTRSLGAFIPQVCPHSSGTPTLLRYAHTPQARPHSSGTPTLLRYAYTTQVRPHSSGTPTLLRHAHTPQLPGLFPDLPVVLKVHARNTPMFSFHPGAVTLILPGAIKAFALQANATRTPLFKLHLDSSYKGSVWVDNGRLKSSVTMDNLNLTLAATTIGPFKTDALENLSRMTMKMLVLPPLNDRLSRGVILPQSRQVHLVQAVVSVEEGFMDLHSDVELRLNHGTMEH